MTEFAAGLRRLREQAGGVTYREMAHRIGFSSTTLSDAAAGRRLPTLKVALAYAHACGGDAEMWERRWHAAAARMSTPSADDADDSDAPYRGLAAYDTDDAVWFCGRDRLVANLRQRLSEHRFVAVFGASGSGKSSLLRAGLLPTLPTKPGAVVLFMPGADPFAACADQLAALLDTSANDIRAELRADPGNLNRVAAAISDEADLIMVVDQFEELFTLCREPDVRTAFIAMLLATTEANDSRCQVVLGVRADFYPHCTLHHDLAAALQDAQVTVGPMTADELRRAITEPARRADCIIESALLTELIAATHDKPAILPLLSHALLQTWRRRAGATLTLAGFHQAGGIDGALTLTADTVYAGFDERQQALARNLFRRLVAPGDDTEDTKRRLRRDDTPSTDPAFDTVLQTLAEHRLIVLGRDDIQLTHEALIRHWPRLRQWLTEDREGLRIHRDLTDAARIWHTEQHHPTTLYRGPRFTRTQQWADENLELLTAQETAFLAESAAVQAGEKQAAERRHRKRRQLITALVAVAVLTAATIGYLINSQQRNNERRNTNALAERVSMTALGMFERYS
ncbi:MAG: helix-turn-helix domain-containing protein [Actinomycetota bacterium]|nr:helix-turn-helix domain-containing protein [Actinomycetota bacterium]